MSPSGESPLLLPANEHKQLIVIDFEYANADLPGYEFANHFVSFLCPQCPPHCWFHDLCANRTNGATTTTILVLIVSTLPSILRLRSNTASFAPISNITPPSKHHAVNHPTRPRRTLALSSPQGTAPRKLLPPLPLPSPPSCWIPAPRLANDTRTRSKKRR